MRHKPNQVIHSFVARLQRKYATSHLELTFNDQDICTISALMRALTKRARFRALLAAGWVIFAREHEP